MDAKSVFFPNGQPITPDKMYMLGGFATSMYEAATAMEKAVWRADLENQRKLSMSLTGGDCTAFTLLYNGFPQTFVAPALACLLLEGDWPGLFTYMMSINPRVSNPTHELAETVGRILDKQEPENDE